MRQYKPQLTEAEREARRKGGLSTAQRHGAEHFRRIGRKGGSVGIQERRDRAIAREVEEQTRRREELRIANRRARGA